MSTNQPLPRYRCHKEIQALKIAHVRFNGAHNGSWTIEPWDEHYPSFTVSAAYINKHNPQVGGYWVL